MEEISKTLQQTQELIKSFGVIGTVFFFLMTIAIFFGIKYWSRQIEKSVDSNHEKLLQKFKIELEKELQEFNMRLSSKLNDEKKAIEEIYAKFTQITSYLDFLNKGDKYEEVADSYEDFKILITHYRQLIQTYGRYKIYLPDVLYKKISHLFPVIENFIDTYKTGHFSSDPQIQVSIPGTNDKFIVAGIWNKRKFDDAINEFVIVQNELEDLFRQAAKI
ncbi:hypothetical protein [Flavobacterium sp.]|uniref:hypothetical protein n=1 Tax=Flavobacterium sp. TaxID=239 RepID=UPI00374D240B